MPLFSAGMIPTADEFNLLMPTWVERTSNLSRDTTTTTEADTELEITFPAAGIWEVEAVLRYNGNGGGLRVDWAISAGVTVNMRSARGIAAAETDTAQSEIRNSVHGATTDVTYGSTTSDAWATELLNVEVATLGETLTLGWAQSTSNANATTMVARSRLIARLIEPA